MAVSEAPLDEVQFRREDVLQYWGGVHSNSIHGYFKESPFFDHTSRNGLLWEQGFLDAGTFELCANRQQLEATLRARPGLEFMVVGEPQPSQDPVREGPDSGIWVLRKQDRAKTARPNHDDLTVLGTYFAVGENLYQAPSVYDVIGNHLMSAMTSLNNFVDQAAALPTYSPSTGYTYLPPTSQDKSASAGSAAATASTSREGSMAPTINSNQDTANNASDPPSLAPSSVSTSNQAQDTFLLEQSLLMMHKHGDEFMDENPLVGEPGNFVYAHTKDLLKARKAEQKQAAALVTAAAAKLGEARQTGTNINPPSAAADRVPSGSATPTTAGGAGVKSEDVDVIMTGNERPPLKKMSKSEASGSGKKRRKSKAAGLLSASNSAKNSPVLGTTSSPPPSR